jgi:hypothetical protein
MHLQGAGGHHSFFAAGGRGGGEGQAIVAVGMTSTLDGDACIAGPTTATTAFILADNLPPRQGARQQAQHSSQSGSLPLDPFCAFTITLIDLQLSGGGSRNNILWLY